MTRAKDISKILTDADISGNIDVDGVTNLDVVDIDGAVDMASTLTVTGVTRVGTSSASASGNLIVGDTSGGRLVLTKRADAYSAGDIIGSLDWYTEDASLDGPNLTARIVATAHGVSGDDANLAFFTKSASGGADATETMRLTLEGNALFGTTTNGTTAVGTVIRATGEVLMTRSGGQPLLLNRTTNDGLVLEVRKDNSFVGSIGTASSRLHIASGGNSGIRFRNDLNCITPCNDDGSNSDNDQNLGQASVRYGTVFATSSSINTSDKNEKQDIEELTDAEKRVAVVAKGLIRKYRWKDAVALKGDNARIHFGIMAQDLQDVFTAESLDASRYGMFCSDTWWEKEISVDAVEAKDEVTETTTDEDGNDVVTVITEAVEAKDAYTYMDDKQEATTGYTEKTRLGVRYSELLAFIISAI